MVLPIAFYVISIDSLSFPHFLPVSDFSVLVRDFNLIAVAFALALNVRRLSKVMSSILDDSIMADIPFGPMAFDDFVSRMAAIYFDCLE